jgi:hypothetical protein
LEEERVRKSKEERFIIFSSEGKRIKSILYHLKSPM